MKWLGQHKRTGKVKSTGSITTGGPVVLQENLSGSLTGSKTVQSTGALTLASTTGVTGNISLDAGNDIYLNADGGDVVFRDDAASLALINTSGLDFTDNTGAGVIFEGATDNAHKTTLSVVDPTGTRAVNLPDASGTVALTSDLLVYSRGWHGSTTRIKILHSDFIADDGGRPLMIDDTDESSEEFFLETFGTFPAYVTVAIPTGYTATHVMIYGSGTGAVEVWEHDITSKTGVSKGTGNVDTEIDITDVASSTTNYLFIQVAAGSDELHGGYVTITTS
jgi:hypothetical protein